MRKRLKNFHKNYQLFLSKHEIFDLLIELIIWLWYKILGIIIGINVFIMLYFCIKFFDLKVSPDPNLIGIDIALGLTGNTPFILYSIPIPCIIGMCVSTFGYSNHLSKRYNKI